MKKIGMMMFAAALLIGAMPMTARAADHDTPEIRGEMFHATSGEALYAGELAGVWTNGYLYAATVDKSLTIIGRTEFTVASNVTAIVKRGVFRWDNGDSSLTSADIGSTCYIWTNTAYTVSTAYSAANTNAVGKIFQVDSDGVWVRSGF